MIMKNQDYYALISYRGKIKYFYVSAEDDNDLRIEHIDYNPNRYNPIWVNNLKNKIVKIFEKGSLEYNYFNSFKKNVNKLIEKLASEEYEKSEDKELVDIFYYNMIGRNSIKKAYKEAYKSTPKPENIDFKI